MKVYLQPPQPSRGLDRIAHALARYAPPGIEVCQFPRNVDLTVIYAIGRRDHIQRQVVEIAKQHKRYAIVQVCLRSTLSPSTADWFDIWDSAQVVWSYYDLQKAIDDDRLSDSGWTQKSGYSYGRLANFLHTPLGVDSKVFQPRSNLNNEKSYVIACSGDNRLQESIRECALAAEAVDRYAFHLGPMTKHKKLISKVGLSDEELAFTFGGCEFVSGLRRTEGFELPAAEGLLCGARPVVFDTPDYRYNYREFAEYIHEGTRAEVVDQLVQLFKQGARPVTESELSEARHWFNWERVCGEFWGRCLG